MAGLTGLEGMQVDIIKPKAGSCGFFDGHGEIVLASGRQHNLGCVTDRDPPRTSRSVDRFSWLGKDHTAEHEFIAGKKQSTNEDVFEVMNGFFCCTVSGDSVQALQRLHKQVRSFDVVLFETTGMADPSLVAQTFLVAPS